jgi:pimeloyl-ACP methyl ester carboxylesterase
MANFVLIHGAWHGGWCWTRVAEHLRRRGHVVHAPSMTGMGDRRHLLSRDITFETHVMDFVNTILVERLDDVVLCGHSFGGIVTTAVADRVADRVRGLVFLDAFLARDGQSVFDLSPPWRTAEILEAARLHGDGWTVPPQHFERWVEDPVDRAWVMEMAGPHPLEAMRQPLSLTGAGDAIANRTYVVAEQYRPSPFWQFHDALKDDPSWHVTGLPTLHDAMISMPDAVAAILEDAAARPRGG